MIISTVKCIEYTELLIKIILQFSLECPEGFFGEGCVNNCSSKCRGCNKVNGLCDRGCFRGWKGDYCQERKNFALEFYRLIIYEGHSKNS